MINEYKNFEFHKKEYALSWVCDRKIISNIAKLPVFPKNLPIDCYTYSNAAQ